MATQKKERRKRVPAGGRRPRLPNEPKGPFRPGEFIATHPVFRFEELQAVRVAAGRSPAGTSAVLRYWVRSGRLRSIRRGLYASYLTDDRDPWLVGSRLTRDAVMAYDAALSFHGFTGPGHGMSYLTLERGRPYSFNDTEYRPVLVPRRLRRLRDWGGGVATVERHGLPLRVTTVERTLVDLLDRLDLGPGIEEVWRAFETARGLDVDFMATYAQKLGSAVCAGRLGFFLEQLGALTPGARRLLERCVPKVAAYFDRATQDRGGQLAHPWNVIVPDELVGLTNRRTQRRR